MSYNAEHFQRFKRGPAPEEIDPLEGLSEDALTALFFRVLDNGIHGFCFSPYENDQKPGDQLSESQIRRRIKIIKEHTRWIRSFSCTEGNELIPQIAREEGLKTMVGAWLGSDLEKNQEEIDGLINLAKKGLVDIAAVGNEVLYRKDLSEEALLNYIRTVKQSISPVPVGYVDAYYEFVQRPNITRACDIILCNCYPFWEGTAFEDSLAHMKSMYQKAKNVAGDKKVIITETGWPTQGRALGLARPSREFALKYFLNTQTWANQNHVENFYFSSFDEKWKVGNEGDVGAHWGIWDSNEQPKFAGT